MPDKMVQVRNPDDPSIVFSVPASKAPGAKGYDESYLDKAYDLAKESKKPIIGSGAVNPPSGSATSRFGEGLKQGALGMLTAPLKIAASPITSLGKDLRLMNNDPNTQMEVANEYRDEARGLPGVSDFNNLASGNIAGEIGGLVPGMLAGLTGGTARGRATIKGAAKGVADTPRTPIEGHGLSGIARSAMTNPIRSAMALAGAYLGRHAGYPGEIAGAVAGFQAPDLMKAGFNGLKGGFDAFTNFGTKDRVPTPIQRLGSLLEPSPRGVLPPDPTNVPITQPVGDIPLAGARTFAPTADVRMLEEPIMDFNHNVPEWSIQNINNGKGPKVNKPNVSNKTTESKASKSEARTENAKSETAENTNKQEENVVTNPSSSTEPSGENQYVSMSWASEQAKNLGLGYQDIVKILSDEGYKVVSDFDIAKKKLGTYGLNVKGKKINP